MIVARYLSFVFFALLMFYFYLGLYVFAQDVRNRFHQAFFAVTMALCTWSLSFALMAHAGTLRGATIVQFTSGLGWGFVYSFLLAFTILLTGYHKKMTKGKWLLVYVPILITLGTYGYSYFTGALEEQIYYGPYGWTLRFQWSLWTLWMRIFYVSVLGVIVVLLRQWAPGKEVFMKGRYKKLLTVSLLATMLLGLPKILGLLNLVERVPFGLGPLVFLPFALTMLYIMVQKNKAERKEEVILPKRGEFLSTKTHEKIYIYLSQGYILGAFISFFVEIMLKENHVFRTSFMTVSLFIVGHTMFMLIKSTMEVQKRDAIINTMAALTIPYITLYQLETSAFFAWTVPVLLTLVAVAFNNTKLLITTSFMTLFTLIFLWMLYPDTRGTFGGADHLSRLLVMALFIFLAFFINDIYRKRLQQFEKQVDHERFISDMSMLLSKARLENLRSNVEVFLEEAVTYMDASFGTIHIFSDEKDGVLRKFLKKGQGSSGLIEKQLNHAKILDHLLEKTVRPQHTEAFITKLIEGYKTSMEDHKVMTLILPIVESEKVIGVIALSTIHLHHWDEGYENTFAIIVKNLSAMLYKIKKEDELYHLAYYDALTDLPNRVLFGKMLEDAMKETEEDEFLAVLFVDLDDFKNINDLLGHSVGDELLKAFVHRMKPLLQKETDMFRFGGDEFLILLPHLKSLGDIHKKASEILAATLAPFVFDEREISTGASIGISVYPTDARNQEDLIRYADLAMYTSKNNGKNRYTILSDDIKGRFVYEKEIEGELQLALKNREFVLYYQPRVDPTTEEILGVEALIRWAHPEKGLLSPGIFLPVAERMGLMADIDRWVFEEACEQNRKWQQTYRRYMSMSINVSPLTFTTNDDAVLFGQYLKERYWDPAYLEVEITENTMYFSVDSTKEKIEALRSLGIIVSLDDFGIAYSSLSRLHELPIDKIKIDRQFILNLDKGKGGRNLFDGMVHLSKSLGLLLNVEGVETKEQADYVKKQGCDEIQGFYYHRPMPAEEVEKLFLATKGKVQTI